MNETLCWKCASACNGSKCPWVRDGTPVKGWVAIPTKIDTHWMLQDSFHVIECPLFAKDKRKYKPNQPAPMPKGCIGIRELAERWKCGKSFIKDCISDGMPHKRDGVRWILNVAECETWMRTSGGEETHTTQKARRGVIRSDGRAYTSITAAAEDNHCNRSKIHDCCNGERRSYKGYGYEYLGANNA